MSRIEVIEPFRLFAIDRVQRFMSDIAIAPPLPAPAHGEAASRIVVIYRTRLWVRIWHWINALSLLFLLLSGLQIFNAHPSLYIGQRSSFDHPFIALRAVPRGDSLRGFTIIAGHPFDTTGVLGASKNAGGQMVGRGFPRWLTIPTTGDLANGRRWHFFFAWIFAINGALYFAYLAISRHLKGELWPTAQDLRDIPRSILDHIRFRHPEGEAAARFNVLQKLAYLTVLLILLPLMILTGMTMSPGLDAVFPVLPWAIGGRQTARTIHFFTAWSIVAFFAIHVFEVFAAGVFNEMRSIVTGRFAIRFPAEPEPVQGESPDPDEAPAAGTTVESAAQ